MADVEECKHLIAIDQCSICNGSDAAPARRAASDVRKDRTFTCSVCGRSLPETSFPTGKPGERLTERCRACRDYLRDQRKAGVDDDDALAKRRRQFTTRRE